MMKKALLAAVAFTVCIGCSGDDASSADDLTAGHFGARGGASGDVTGNSINIFKDLYSRGLHRARLVTYISYGRGPQVSAAALNLVAQKVDLFISVFVAECGDSPSTGCQDLWQGDATNAADKTAIKDAFKVHFQSVFDAVNPVVGASREINVKTWGVNEPDNAMGGLADWPERAALFYLGAREVLDASGCGSCELPAGEFSRFGGSVMAADFKRYVDELHDDGQFPTVFSLHPYGDVNAVDAGNWSTIHAHETDAFEASVNALAPKAQIWLTEVGRMLHEINVSHAPSDEWASGAYVRRRLAFHPGVTRVYWYQMAALPTGWDTALADKEVMRRASFFGFIGDDENTSLEKAKVDASNPAPDH